MRKLIFQGTEKNIEPDYQLVTRQGCLQATYRAGVSQINIVTCLSLCQVLNRVII